MILKEEICEIGQFNKPHGINGEISATFECDVEDVESLSCIVVDVDGIFVPFFVSGIRPKRATTLLLKIDDVDSEEAAKAFVGKPIYALRDQLEIEYADDDLRSLVGYTVSDERDGILGEIVDIEDSTENMLFIVETSDGENFFIPIADEFIIAIDDDARRVEMRLPEGITEL